MLNAYLSEKSFMYTLTGAANMRNFILFFLHKLGISHRVSCPHTHQQNGTAERKHRHIVETGPTLLAHASVPLHFWSDALSTACFLINRLPSRVIAMNTPFERLLHEKPDYSFFKVFGCACWPHLRSYNSHKLDFQSKKCVFLGYSSLHKGYKCLHVPSNRVYISRDVVFDENVFPFADLPLNSTDASFGSPSVISPDQLVDIACCPLLLPNHGASFPRGARVDTITNDDPKEPDSPGASPVRAAHSSAALSPQPPSDDASAQDAELAQAAATAQAPEPHDVASLPAPDPAPIPTPAPFRPHTRLQDGIRKPLKRTDGTVTYMTHVRRASTESSLEPCTHYDALHSPH